jgi:hypothetical protein
MKQSNLGTLRADKNPRPLGLDSEQGFQGKSIKNFENQFDNEEEQEGLLSKI